ncbi:choice-of-anchor B family protein [Seonamhaeicola marinus]|uniref:Choice-of-anchor B family protein n=1 Tax=Seonamhaeicola marinus TaxID=1912246 RepID=A0A5D0HFR0_9FLAO|nr:choice-of-anchor B family protein [Seonamhaeicola marinus]TYA70136.1 choice-of-anchor B family protein [Seonamhaeicola marinus]
MSYFIKKLCRISLFGLFCATLIFSCERDNNIPLNTDISINEDVLAPCVNGFAAGYPCRDYDLMAHLPVDTFDGNEGNDSWGWVDETTQKEYALMCLDNGVGFVDITDALNPIYLGKLPTATIASPWRDVKIYQNHAFIVADNSVGEDSHGMQIFDLTRLRNVANPPETFTEDLNFTGFGRAHNLFINEETGYAYIVGSSSFLGGPIFINIQDPMNPVIEGGFINLGYSHDAQVVTYNGPDSDYTGQEIFIGSNEDEVVIVNVTDKTNPTIISRITYTNVRYAHQGWFTSDMKYFILGDELDELRIGIDTKTIVFDFTDLDNPQFHFNYFGPTSAIDHNGYVKGDNFFFANYNAGMRVLDISDIENTNVSEVGFFDTYPDNNNTGFDGAWTVYPYLPSGNIIISDVTNGLFIVRKSGT